MRENPFRSPLTVWARTPAAANSPGTRSPGRCLVGSKPRRPGRRVNGRRIEGRLARRQVHVIPGPRKRAARVSVRSRRPLIGLFTRLRTRSRGKPGGGAADTAARTRPPLPDHNAPAAWEPPARGSIDLASAPGLASDRTPGTGPVSMGDSIRISGPNTAGAGAVDREGIAA